MTAILAEFVLANSTNLTLINVVAVVVIGAAGATAAFVLRKKPA